MVETNITHAIPLNELFWFNHLPYIRGKFEFKFNPNPLLTDTTVYMDNRLLGYAGLYNVFVTCDIVDIKFQDYILDRQYVVHEAGANNQVTIKKHGEVTRLIFHPSNTPELILQDLVTGDLLPDSTMFFQCEANQHGFFVTKPAIMSPTPYSAIQHEITSPSYMKLKIVMRVMPNTRWFTAPMIKSRLLRSEVKLVKSPNLLLATLHKCGFLRRTSYEKVGWSKGTLKQGAHYAYKMRN